MPKKKTETNDKEKLKEIKSLFLSPPDEMYPETEVIESRLFSHRINYDKIAKDDLLMIQGVQYKVVNEPIWQPYFDNDAYKRVELIRISDDNLYSFTINKIVNYKGRAKYQFENMVESILYIHDVTVRLPVDSRPLTKKSNYDEEGLKIIYEKYDAEKAFKRDDFLEYCKENKTYKSLIPDDKNLINLSRDEIIRSIFVCKFN